jgi:hypothetical protein
MLVARERCPPAIATAEHRVRLAIAKARKQVSALAAVDEVQVLCVRRYSGLFTHLSPSWPIRPSPPGRCDFRHRAAEQQPYVPADFGLPGLLAVKFFRKVPERLGLVVVNEFELS